MALDPVIAGGFRGLQLQDPLEQYGRISQIQQAQQQNQLAALKMQEYQRGAETQNRLRSLDPSAANYMTEVMRLDPDLGSQLLLRSKQQTAAERAAAASEAEGRAKNLSYWQGLARDSSRTPTDDVVAGLARRAVELGVTDEGTASSQLQQLLAMPPEQRTQVLAQYGASAAAPPAAPATPADVATMKALGFPLTQQGYEQFRAAQRQPPTYTPSPDMQGYELAKSQGYNGTFFDYQRQLAEAKRPPAQPKEPNKPVEVVGPDGKTIIVSAEEAIARRMTPAKAMEGLAPKEIQRREAVFPQAKQSVATVTNTMSTIEQTIDRLLQNKSGLNGVTGLVGGRTPALTDAARAADADLEQLANLAFVQGITELRAASKTGAGVGNVSNKEGDRFENLKASLKRTQSYDDMVAALKRLKAQAGSTRDTVSTEFTDMYDYRQGRAAPAGARPSLDSIFK